MCGSACGPAFVTLTERCCGRAQVTTSTPSHLNGKHVVFGVVVGAESMEAVRRVEAVGSQGGATSATVTIVDCGEGGAKKED